MTTATHPGTAIQQAARHLAEGRAETAIEVLSEAARDFPTYVTAHVLLARAYESARRTDQALDAWHRAYFLMPTSRLIQRQRERLLQQQAAGLTEIQPPPAIHPPETPDVEPGVIDEIGEEWTWDAELPNEPTIIDTEDHLIDRPPPADESGEFEAGGEDLADEQTDAREDFLTVEETSLDDVEADLDIADDLSAEVDWVEIGADEEDEDVVEAEIIPPGSRPSEEQPPDEPDGNGWRISEEMDSPESIHHGPPPTPPAEEEPPHEPPPDPLDELEDLDALIDQLERAPRIKPEAGEEGEGPDEDDDLENDLVTETLARIYEAQGQLTAAADAYTRLARQHPERGEEFEQRAAELRRRNQA